ncbi:MAG: protein kinase [Vicinamibacterales bacterium]
MSNLSGQLLGHYKVLEPLGAGGMGVVYRAQDTVLGRMVALKVLPTTASSDPEAGNRFRREARTASSLNHPNICTIYGFDEQEGRCYLAMELLEGETLDRRLVQGPLDQRALIDIASQVADALDAAHSEGILHRDIKPANIFLTKRGQAKVLDFGLAKLTAGRHGGGVDASTTVEPSQFTSVVGTTVGTVAYMSPEQARAEALDSRTDLFSFGVVLYEMATGRVTFPGNTTAVIFDGILNREPTPASAFNRDVSPELDRIIAKALEKDRALRYQTAADLRVDLQRLHRDSSTRRVSSAAVSGATAAASSRASDPTVALPPPRNSMAAIDPASAVTMAVPAATASPSSRDAEPPPTMVIPPAPAPSATPLPAAPAAAAAPPRRSSSVMLAAVGAVAAAVLIGVVVMPRQQTADAVPAEPAPAVTPADAPAPPPDAAAPGVAATTPPTTAASTAATTTTPPKTATGAVPPPGKGGPATKGTPGAPPTAPDAAREAATRLDVAREKLNSNLVDQGIADLRAIVSDYPATAVAADASYLAAQTLTRLGRADDAMAAHLEFANRFAGDPRFAESQVTLGELTLKSRQPNREETARAIFGRAAAAAPGTPAALRALQAKAGIEERRRLRERDPSIGREVPAQLATLRTLADQFPDSPHGMLALYRLGTLWADLDQWNLAAHAYTDLATRYPSNPHDAWWLLGELYERRLRDDERARAAYAQVPQTSKRYQDAQRKLTRR